MDRGEKIKGKKRKIEKREIMVMVRKSEKLMNELQREMKKMQVKVEGEESMKIKRNIDIKEMMEMGSLVMKK